MVAITKPEAQPIMPEVLRSLKIAIVHDYLNQPGGAEKVVLVLSEMFPEAPIYTSVFDAAAMPPAWRELDIRTSFMQRISPRLSIARAMVPLYPTAFEQFDLREYDLVLSSTTAFAKGILTRPTTCHICYCNNPTRFLWMYQDYISHARLPAWVEMILPWLTSPLRVWDYVAAQRPDYFVAGSYNAGRRIAKYYRRESDVVQAPIDAAAFRIASEPQEYFLVVSRLQPYKRIDLAIEACNRLRLPLHIVGAGADRSRLEKLAGPTIRFLGRLPDEEVREQMAHCRALIFPGEEDFGLTPLESMASGRPVIAFAAGGALETVEEGKTGTFFRRPTVDSLCSALASFRDDFDPNRLRAHAMQFDKEIFKRRLFDVLARRYGEYRGKLDEALHDVP